jgi:glycosyltransferase involved in cell wall biosynthesis
MLFTYNWEIKKQMDEFKPDVVINHSLLTNYLAMKQCKKRNIPCVFHLFDSQYSMIPFKPLQPLGKIIEKRILKNSDAVIVINEKLKKYAVEMGANPDETHIISAGIDLKRYNAEIKGDKIRDKYGIKKDTLVLFFMGWIYHFSGLKEVAIELSKTKNNDILMLVVGDGDAFNDLQKIKKEHQLGEKLILTGKQPYDSIPEFIASSDICILPAYNNEVMRDVVPIKFYEYMAMRKPVITTKLPGVMKEFGEDHGVVYVEKPEDTLKKALELKEKNSINENGMKAGKYVEKYDWVDITNKFEKTLEGLI